MNKNWLLISTLLMTLSGTAGAVTLSLSPSSLTIPVNTDYSVDLVVSDLDVPGGEVVGGFDVDISFDPTQASFLGYTLGTSLGDEGFFEALDFSLGDLGGGLIDLAEVSLLSTAELLPIQTESFTLATLDFHCLGCGTSLIEIVANDP